MSKYQLVFSIGKIRTSNLLLNNKKLYSLNQKKKDENANCTLYLTEIHYSLLTLLQFN